MSSAPARFAPTPPVPAARPDLVMRWLLAVAAMVVVMVIVGGITRLTESGLSITQWNPVTGALPPLNDAAWQREFALYQKTTEFQTVNRSMDLAAFKQIYFWEWFHRLLARLVGLVYAAPFVWFWWRKQIPAGLMPRLWLLLLLGGAQGAIGWWMVASGLVGRTDVSHFRLAVHLSMALLILGLLVWTARDCRQWVRDGAHTFVRPGRAVAFALGVIAVQIVWGAFTAGLNAGWAFSSWPLMGDSLFPAGVPMPHGLADATVNNPVVVQFIHRWWAFAAAAAAVWLAARARGAGEGRAALTLGLLVIVQIALGIATLMTGVDIHVAVAHQGTAALIVGVAAWCAHAAASARTLPAG